MFLFPCCFQLELYASGLEDGPARCRSDDSLQAFGDAVRSRHLSHGYIHDKAFTKDTLPGLAVLVKVVIENSAEQPLGRFR